jgi:PAS domain S-box-containing protein
VTDPMRSVLAAMPHAMVAVAPDDTVTAISTRASELLGLAEAEIVGRNWPELVEEVGLPRRLGSREALDGSRVQLQGRIELDVDATEAEDGTWVYLIRRPGRRARREERLRNLLMGHTVASTDSVELLDTQGRFVYVNPAWEAMLGYTLDEAVGRAPRELLRSGVHSTAFYRAIWDSLARGEQWTGRIVSRRKDGTSVESQLTLVPQRSALGVPLGTVGIRRDLAPSKERETLERQLHHVERMAGLGQLAAGVAHEINNPLTYVMANLSWLDRELARGLGSADLDEIHEVLQESQGGATRIASIVGDLKIFARSRKEETLAAVDIESACDAAINLARNQLQHRAHLIRDYVTTSALANEVRLVQVIVNLLVNAVHATPVGDADNNNITVSIQQAENLVYIEVRDTGAGIDPENLPHIFEPFFTTKPQGEGTGLGLSVCLGLIEKMGGRIDVESEVGVGSTFRVTLHCATPDEGPTTRDLRRSARRAQLRLLVVDDEPLIGQSLKRLLRDDDVHVAHDGEQALEILEQDAEFDFVLCDVMMPGMTGVELSALILEKHPWLEQRLALMTGGAFIPEIWRQLAEIELPCFDKPLDMDVLKEWFSKTSRPPASRN